MPNVKILGVGVILAAAILVYLSAFMVDEREKAIVLRIGKIVRADYEPGLNFMVPFINNVRKFDRRLLTLDSSPEQILTGEKKNVSVDYFVKWYIRDVTAYYLAFGGIEERAMAQLSDVIRGSLQAELGDRTIKEVVSTERDAVMINLATTANEKIGKFGIEIVDVRIKQIELPAEVRSSVFTRMRAERERIAREHRAKGEKESKIIRATVDRRVIELISGAERKAEIIRGNGDATATETYAKAYNQDAEFYAFYRSLAGYKKAFSSKQDIIVLQPDSEFFEYFGSSKAR